MLKFLNITISPTNANRSFFSRESNTMVAIEDTIETAIKKYGGTLFSTISLHYLAAFTNDLILTCSLEIFDQLLELIGSKNIRALRISIGSGSAIRIRDHYLGTGVLQAQRLNTICPPGQILMTKEIFSALPAPALSNIYDYGFSALTDLQEPLHLIGTTSNAEINPTRISDKKISVPHNLPVYHTPLSGRTNDIYELKNMLLNCRLLSIIGSAGTGKTRLGIHLGAECHKVYKHGVFYFCFESHLDLHDQIFKLASAMGFIFTSFENIEDQLCQFLHNKKVLLIADTDSTFSLTQINFIKKLLHHTVSASILILAREPLYIDNENYYEIHNISSVSGPQSIDALYNPEHAVYLYLTHAISMYSDPNIADTDIATIFDICDILKGNPLAIVMAAAWNKTAKPHELYSSLQQMIPEFEERETTVPGMPKRNNRLRAMFEAALKNLTHEEYEAFIKLSIFKTSFTESDAQHAAGVTSALLSRLVHKSPIQLTFDKQYRMSKVFKRIAYEELLASPFLNSIHTTFYQHYLAFIISQSQSLHTQKQKETLTLLSHEKENILSSWHMCINSGTLSEIEQFITPLFDFFELSAAYNEGITAFEYLKKNLEDPLLDVDSLVRICLGKIYCAIGTFYRNLNHHDTSAVLLLKSMDIWDDLTAHPDSYLTFRKKDSIILEHARCMTQYGELLRKIGRSAEALEYCEKGLQLFKSINDMFMQGWTHGVIGLIYSDRYDPAKAVEHFKESLETYKYGSSPSGIAWAQQNLAHCYYNNGNFTEAQKYYSITEFERYLISGAEESSLLYINQGTETDLENLYTLCGIHHEVGNYEKALALAEQTLVISSEGTSRETIADSIRTLAAIHSSMGNFKKAKVQLQEALEIYQSISSNAGLYKTTIELAKLHFYIEKYAIMKEYLKKIQTHKYPVSDEKTDVDFYNTLGLCDFLHNEWLPAEEHFKYAYDTSVRIQYEAGMVRAKKNFLKLELHFRNYTKALKIFSELIESGNKSGHIPIILESLFEMTQILIELKEFEFAMDTLIYIYNHPASSGYVKNSAKKRLFKLPPKYGKQFFFYCINNEELRSIDDFSRTLFSNISIALKHSTF